MGFLDIISSMGLGKINVKFAVEIFSKQIIKHVGHKVDRYNAMFNFETGFIEFMVFHPETPNGFPETYCPPMNNQFKGQKRVEVPVGARLYDMDVKSTIDTIKDIVSSQLKDFKGNINYVFLEVNRDSNEIPCTVYYQSESGEKHKLNHILK